MNDWNNMHTSNENNANQLTSAYNQMMLGIRHAYEDAESDEFSLQKALLMAKDEVIRLGEITLSDAQDISEYIKRDINEAAEYMMEASEEFCDWLMLDIDIVERKVVDMFLSVADKTRLEIDQLSHNSQSPSIYMMGEITGFGTLQCTSCGEHSSFKTTTVIRACACGNTKFTRIDDKL